MSTNVKKKPFLGGKFQNDQCLELNCETDISLTEKDIDVMKTIKQTRTENVCNKGLARHFRNGQKRKSNIL